MGAHDNDPLWRLRRESTSSYINATTIIPSTPAGNSPIVRDASPHRTTS
ncbi:hypothetical protein [Actinomadura sp. KC216]|nr:hypothetical protein [Actinomadura sp. KC216]